MEYLLWCLQHVSYIYIHINYDANISADGEFESHLIILLDPIRVLIGSFDRQDSCLLLHTSRIHEVPNNRHHDNQLTALCGSFVM